MMKAKSASAPVEVKVPEPENDAPEIEHPVVLIDVLHPGPRPLVVVVTEPTSPDPQIDPADGRKVIIVRLPVNISYRPDAFRENY